MSQARPSLRTLLVSSLEEGIKKGAVQLIVTLLAVLTIFLAMGFLILALYFFFETRTSPPIAALACAGVLLATALLIAGLGKWLSSRKSATPAAVPPIIDRGVIDSARDFITTHPAESVVLAAITGLAWQSSTRERELVLEIVKASLAKPTGEAKQAEHS
ncbi:MAG: hypothetical protein QNK37_37395 [Acidobacteriota bacterium]|nr:hypothetical protein [Acidobacteriota bacterium]